MKYLYILVRTDMDSLGRGKSIAQGAHAANQFTDDHIIAAALKGEAIDPEVLAWTRLARGFGPTLTLGMSLKEMQTCVMFANALGYPASMVVDPDYPLLDGGTLHLIPDVETTAYIFGEKEDLRPILGGFDLMPNDPVPTK